MTIEAEARRQRMFDFFRRSAAEHRRLAHHRAVVLGGAALAEASGASFFQSSFWRLGAWSVGRESPYYQTWRARGRGSLHPPRGGWLISGLATAASTHYAFTHPLGPLIGFGATVTGSVAGAVLGRLGWGYGAALGAASGGFWRRLLYAPRYLLGSRLGRGWYNLMSASLGSKHTVASVLTRGLVWGSTFGLALGSTILMGAVMPIALEEGFRYAAQQGFRLSRRGFANLYGPYRDTPYALTMRQQALAAISQSQLNARAALGTEAALLHFS